MMALFAMPVFAQTIESVDVSKAKDGKFTTQSAECTIEGYVVKGQKVGTWMEYYNSNTYLPKRIINYENGKKNGVYVEIDKTGSIEKKAEYKNDALDGQVSEWYRGGRLSKLNSYKTASLMANKFSATKRVATLKFPTTRMANATARPLGSMRTATRR
jgi:antitoxin component YwqK of YwqJK toxin-antitoxin module